MTTRSAPPVLDRLITLHIQSGGGFNEFGERQPSIETDAKVWARRRDVSAAEQIQLDPEGRLVVQPTRLMIRFRDDVKVDGFVTDDAGERRRITGLAEVGRMRHLELLAEVIR